VSLCVFVTPSPVYDSGRYIEIWLSLYHAYQTPKLEIIAIETEKKTFRGFNCCYYCYEYKVILPHSLMMLEI
jgi:hypothetical protein